MAQSRCYDRCVHLDRLFGIGQAVGPPDLARQILDANLAGQRVVINVPRQHGHGPSPPWPERSWA